MDSSSPAKEGQETSLHTPDFEAGADACIRFGYHMYGIHIGFLKVIQTFADGSQPQELFYREADQGNFWNNFVARLTPSAVTRVSFYAGVGSCAQGDIALDAVVIETSNCDVTDGELFKKT